MPAGEDHHQHVHGRPGSVPHQFRGRIDESESWEGILFIPQQSWTIYFRRLYPEQTKTVFFMTFICGQRVGAISKIKLRLLRLSRCAPSLRMSRASVHPEQVAACRHASKG